MPEAPALFYEDYYDALRDDVKAVGGNKVVGKLLYFEKDVESASRALADKLNDRRRERLTDEQERLIMRLAREKRGFSAALCFICDDTDFERPKARAPEDERLQLQRKVVEAAATFKHCVDRLERLTRSPLESSGT